MSPAKKMSSIVSRIGCRDAGSGLGARGRSRWSFSWCPLPISLLTGPCGRDSGANKQQASNVCTCVVGQGMSEAPSSSSEQSSSGVSSNNAAAIATLQAYVPKQVRESSTQRHNRSGISLSSHTTQPQMLHESDANYAERVAVFKQHVAELGIERAETLSTVRSTVAVSPTARSSGCAECLGFLT